MRQKVKRICIFVATLKQCHGWSAHGQSTLRRRPWSPATTLTPKKYASLFIRPLHLSEEPIDDGMPSRSPLTDAFRVQRYSDWAGLKPSPEITMGRAYLMAGVATIASWTACAVKALTYHPDAALEAICGFRHNALTIGQALAFPIPLVVAVAVVLRRLANQNAIKTVTFCRLNLGLATSSLWLGLSAAYMPAFACGYQLYSPALRSVATLAHISTALLCLINWSKTIEKNHKISRTIQGLIGSSMCLAPKNASDNPDTRSGSDGRNEYALCSFLFLWFTIMPIAADFPLATVPSILGRRLSRAASAWTFLAGVVSYAIKDGIEKGEFGGINGNNGGYFTILRTGLAVGSAAHLFIIALKLIGIDGGGFLLPGRGLWEVYPMALAVPFTAASSLIMHLVAIFASRLKTRDTVSEVSLGAFE